MWMERSIFHRPEFGGAWSVLFKGGGAFSPTSAKKPSGKTCNQTF